MRTSKFVVTGCSRSGTQYIARLLSAVGYKCGHEAIFKYDYLRHARQRGRAFADFPELDGDSSSGAAPFLQELPAGTLVLHQVRHPVESIRSHLGIRSFAVDHVPSPYLADDHVEQVAFFEGQFCPEIFRHSDEAVRSMCYWVQWNRMVETVGQSASLRYLRYRVEEVSLSRLRAIVGLIGGTGSLRSDEELERALSGVSRTTNTRRRDESITWATLPDGPEKAELERCAIEYGYVLDYPS